MEEKIADACCAALDQLDFQRVRVTAKRFQITNYLVTLYLKFWFSFQNQNERLIGDLFDMPPEDGKMYSRIPMVTPDVNFVNMLRYSMLAISLLPENSISRKSF